ncbi:MAG TPA: tubulin-like doman-containing protein [Allosphingosinicella sp.]|jgi:hypothetical protein|uniref:tubulin-like doman-containing protein n=1 Tax=Allosphingosinicella sp. TaxID=2823234 RepID=UPI002F28CE84
MADDQGASATQVVEVRPTVFVALGGTGMEVLLRLRRRILQADWKGTRLNSLSEFPVASFLYFDTDTNEARETGRAATTDPMAEAVAFGKGDTLQAKVDVNFYQRNKSNYPAIAEWLPSRDLSHIDTEKGAGQVRSISRLLFFHQFDQFKRAISEKGSTVLDNVSTHQALTRLGISTQRQLRVVVVGSLAGGTGSGAFIDAGLAISSMLTPKADQVDLFLMLPSGYAGANRDRVFANGFAALSELEYVMRPNPQPPYVRNWTSVERPSTNKPYSDVYLFDTRNINRDQTERVDDIYDMIADILFEDFGSSEFARKKRSIAVNQQQHKMRMFHPPIGGDDKHSVLAYSRGYSAIGQSIVATTGSLELEAAVSDASRTMLQAFFGVFEGAAVRLPGVKDRDLFMRSRMHLTPKMFDDFPEHLAPRPGAIPAYQLIDQLLVSEDMKSIHGRLVEDIATEVRAMREQASEPKDWAAQGEKIRARYEAEVLARAGTASIRKGEVEAARGRLLRALTAEEGAHSLKQALYDLVDDRQNGGLDFTIALVEQIRDELAKPGTGIRVQMDGAATQFRSVADQIMSKHLVGSLQKLERAAKPNFLGRVDRAAAEEYLGQFEADLGQGLKFWLRAIAATEAQKLLDDLANYLGERSVPDDEGEVTWTGFLRELDGGRRSVRAVLEMVSAEATRVRDAVNRPDSGVYIVIDRGAGKIAEERIATEPKAWADEKFDDFGGCRRLFPMLRNDADRLRLINQLRAIAKEKLADEERRIPSAVEAIRSLTPDEKRKTIERMLARAMPWMPAQFDRFIPSGDQFKMIIAAPDAQVLRDEFSAIIQDAMPKLFGIAPPTIEESGVRGRIICYCELSGYPLDAIAPLRDDWRKSYEKELAARDPLPLHNHQDHLRFPNPVVPTIEELAHQKEVLATFLKAMMTGALTRGAMAAESGREDSNYYVDMSRHDLQSVGTERKIRLKGFEGTHLGRIRFLIDQFEGKLGAVQWLALAALAEWNARRAYAPPLERDAYGNDSRPKGLGHQVCMGVADEYKRRAKSATDARGLPLTANELVMRFADRIDAFSREVEGSLNDVEGSEANRNPDDAPERRAVDKRMIDPAGFTPEALLDLVRPRSAQAPNGGGQLVPPPPPPQQPVSFYVAVGGQTQGPFDLPQLGQLRRSGQLEPATLVFNAGGGTAWQPASAEGALAILFAPQPPPPPGNFPPPPPTGALQ